MSLGVRLSLLTLAVLFGLLVAGGFFQYLALGEFLRRDDATLLQQRYNQTIRDLGVRGRVCTASGVLGGAGARATPAVVAGRITPAAAQCIVEALGGPLVTVAVLDPAGGLVASAPAGASPPLLPAAQYSAVGGPGLRPYYISGDGDAESLVVLHDLARNGHQVGVVQMSQPTAVLKQTQQRLLTILVVATGALMVVALLLVPLLVKRALLPLRRVTEASAELAGGDFARRVEEPRSRDELGRVARAFNEMAGAVQRAVTVRAESEAGMRHFVGDASHELRTPLTTLQGQLDLLGRGAAADPEAQRAALTAMQREVNRMSMLVEDLLTLTRLEAAELAQGRVRQPVDIDALIFDAVDEQSVRAPGQQLVVEAANPGQAVTLGDPDQLRRVLLNLTNNAVSHAPGGIHTWRSRVEADQVVVSLSDQGPGISAEALPRLFDRFYRAQPPSGQPGAGSGLGLAIVRSIVEAHGGTVEAAGNPGGGTTVTVRLPRAAASMPPT